MAERKVFTPEMLCGFCNTAWDIIMGRQAFHRYNPGYWLGRCPTGGCDPDCWDYVDEEGNPTGDKPEFSKKLFHRRDHRVPWNMSTTRKVPREELVAMEVERQKAVKAAIKEDDELEWL